MKKPTPFALIATFVFLLSMSSCDFIGDVFEAGFWTAVVVIVILVVLVIWIIRKLFG